MPVRRRHHWVVIAADGAYHTCLENKIAVDWVIGDGDSLVPSKSIVDKIITIKYQGNTDFEKCLEWIKQNHLFPTCVFGIGGGDLDHALNNLYILARWGSIYPIVAYNVNDNSESQVCFLLQEQLQCRVNCGQTISILPITPMEVTSNGLEWELTNAALSPTNKTSARNCATSDHLKLISKGTGLITLSDSDLACDAVNQYIKSFMRDNIQ